MQNSSTKNWTSLKLMLVNWIPPWTIDNLAQMNTSKLACKATYITSASISALKYHHSGLHNVLWSLNQLLAYFEYHRHPIAKILFSAVLRFSPGWEKKEPFAHRQVPQGRHFAGLYRASIWEAKFFSVKFKILEKLFSVNSIE